MGTAADEPPWRPVPPRSVVLALDVAMATARPPLRVSLAIARRVGSVTRPVASAWLRPPLARVARRGRPYRVTMLADLDERVAARLDSLLDVLVPVVLEQVLRRVDLAKLIERHLDLDGLLTWMDVDSVAARLDVDKVAGRLDVAAVIEQLDLTRIVRDDVDLDAVVAGVDINAIAARLDLDAVVARLDLAALAADVVASLDLPEIIRESTSAVSSETVREVRMRGIAADDMVSRAAGRLGLGRRRPDTSLPLPPVPPEVRGT